MRTWTVEGETAGHWLEAGKYEAGDTMAMIWAILAWSQQICDESQRTGRRAPAGTAANAGPGAAKEGTQAQGAPAM